MRHEYKPAEWCAKQGHQYEDNHLFRLSGAYRAEYFPVPGQAMDCVRVTYGSGVFFRYTGYFMRRCSRCQREEREKQYVGADGRMQFESVRSPEEIARTYDVRILPMTHEYRSSPRVPSDVSLGNT